MEEITPLKVLALEPYYGGSHRAFLDTWTRFSAHRWTLETMPARHWKWRMRGAAMWFAEKLHEAPAGKYDALLTCDMTSVADLRALLPAALNHLPIVCYFHENQLTYPLSPTDRVDYQFGLTNITSALAADAVWFNSKAHRGAFLEAAQSLIRKMSDCLPRKTIASLDEKCVVQYPAIEMPSFELPSPTVTASATATAPAGGASTSAAAAAGAAGSGTLRILWSHRWEYDKNPESFFRTMHHLHEAGMDFELVLVGERFRTVPSAFTESFRQLSPHIVHAGYLGSRDDYWRMLAGCDIVVSTAIQENFGIAVAEAILAGVYPLLPDRLSYPELLPQAAASKHLYADDAALLAKLRKLLTQESIVQPAPSLAAHVTSSFAAPVQCGRLDHAFWKAVCGGSRRSQQ